MSDWALSTEDRKACSALRYAYDRFSHELFQKWTDELSDHGIDVEDPASRPRMHRIIERGYGDMADEYIEWLQEGDE